MTMDPAATLTTPPAAPASATKPPADPKTTTPEPSVIDNGPDPFDELDRKWDARTATPAAPPKEPAKEPAGEPGKPQDEPKPDGDGKTAEPAPQKRVVEPKALRAQLEKVSGELKSANDARLALEKKIADAEAKGKDTTVLAERLAKRDKEVEDLRAELRAAKREVAPEFIEKYDKPFNLAAAHAQQVIEKLRVVESVDDESGEAKYRPAKWEDFVRLYHLPEGEDALEAEKLFGKTSRLVKHHLRKLKELDYVKQVALEEEKGKWEERTKAEEATKVQQREAFERASAKVDQDLKTKHPDWYADDPNDPDGNKLLQEGYALVDSKPRSFQEAIVIRANIRNRAAAFPRLVARNKALKTEVDALKAKIEEMKGSGPGPTKRGAEGEPKPETDWKDDLRKELA